jgi:hypothetical protein
MPALLALRALPWRLIGLSALAFAILALFAHDRIMTEQNGKLKAQLHAITSAQKQQKRTTERTVREVVEGQERVKTIVRVIHDAPNPEGCRTPALDELRRVL